MKQPWAWRAAFVRCASVLCAVVASVVGIGFAAAPVSAGPVSIAVMNCGLIDDNAAYNDAETNRTQQARIDMISNALRAQLDASQRYRVADNGRAADLIARLGSARRKTSPRATTAPGRLGASWASNRWGSAGCRKSAT